MSCLEAAPSVAAEPLDVDRPFRVEAGPGAGKTHWLIGHIRHTLSHGMRLRENPRARIACITYTHAGTETARERLGRDADRLWISTIHSFLYHHLVRPYAHLLGIEGFKTALLRGHDIVRPSSEDGRAWLKDLDKSERLWHSTPVLRQNLTYHLIWHLKESGDWEVTFSKSTSWKDVKGVRSPSKIFGDPQALLAYKVRLWNRGRIDHDDVVHLAHRIATERPGIIKSLAYRFPYIFLDEYQDTTPRQAEIVDAFVNAGAVVGVIGDLNQSIFNFTGASPESFRQFNPAGVQTHTLADNYRSTPSIVRVLNAYRCDDDVTQQSAWGQPEGAATPPPPMVIEGSVSGAYAEALRRIPGGWTLHAIGRSHDDVRDLTRAIHGVQSIVSPWDSLSVASFDDARLLSALTRGVRLAREGGRRDAIHAFDDLFRYGGGVQKPLTNSQGLLTPMRRRTVAALLLAAGESIERDATARAALNSVSEVLERSTCGVTMRPISTRSGSARESALDLPFAAYLDTVELDAAVGVVRTIHKFKGDEADAVLVVVSKKELLQRLIAPQRDNETTRLLYVALSRARTHLFVNVPRLSDAERTTLENRGFDVVPLKESSHVESMAEAPKPRPANRKQKAGSKPQSDSVAAKSPSVHNASVPPTALLDLFSPPQE